MHTKATMTESELKDYLREHVGVEQPLFAPGATIKTADMTIEISANKEGAITDVTLQPKKRGWPKGKKRGPRRPKSGEK